MDQVLDMLLGVLSASLIYLTQDRFKQKNKRKELESKLESKASRELELMSDGICCMLKINIIDYHKRYMHDGSIPLYALDNVKTMYKVYSNFGANGIHDIMEELGDLPIRN